MATRRREGDYLVLSLSKQEWRDYIVKGEVPNPEAAADNAAGRLGFDIRTSKAVPPDCVLVADGKGGGVIMKTEEPADESPPENRLPRPLVPGETMRLVYQDGRWQEKPEQELERLRKLEARVKLILGPDPLLADWTTIEASFKRETDQARYEALQECAQLADHFAELGGTIGATGKRIAEAIREKMK